LKIFKEKVHINTIKYHSKDSDHYLNSYIVSINIKEIKSKEILKIISQKRFGMFNAHLITLKFKSTEFLDISDRVSIEFNINDVSFNDKFNSYTIVSKKTHKILETTKNGFIKYLYSNLDGIGEKKAIIIFETMLSEYGEDKIGNFLELFKEDVLNETEYLTKKVLKNKTLDKIKNQLLKKNSNEINLDENERIFCAESGFNINTILRLKKQLLRNPGYSKKIKEENYNMVLFLKKIPYIIALDNNIKRFSFKSIDLLVLKIMKDDFKFDLNFRKQRFIGFLKFILLEAKSDGHVYLTIDVIKSKYIQYNDDEEDEKKLFVLEENLLSQIHKYLKEIHDFLEFDLNTFIFEEDRIYLKELNDIENEVVKELNRLKSFNSSLNIEEKKLIKLIRQVEIERKIKLSEEQFNSVLKMLKNGLSVLTGGPGTGKTTTSQVLIDVFKVLYGKNSVKILAPTGTAAKRISQITGITASTVHRGLGFKGKTWDYNQENPLKEKVIVVDESSMIDLPLVKFLLHGIKTNSHLIFIGDINQLPSVGPGSVLKDIIKSKQFQVNHLTQVFRQAMDNPIVSFAYKVNNGDNIKSFFPWFYKEAAPRELTLLMKDNFKKSDEIDYLNNMTIEAVNLGLIKYKQCKNIFDFQILALSNRVTDKINQLLQSKLNKKGKIIENSIFRIYDKVIQTRNNYQLNVFNGDIGIIVSDKNNKIQVKLNNGDIIEYEQNQLKELKLCYAMTVHKSQGQEYKDVVMIINDYMLNNREIIYTGATRAKEKLTIICNSLLLSMGINTTTTDGGKKERFSYLSNKLNDNTIK